MNQFFGKYRGKVENNVDPMLMGRVQVSVPAVLGDGRLSWAMPCTPYAGSRVGFFTIPSVGTNVWVEFEAGDTNYPIWSGCFWDQNEAPGQALAGIKIFQTDEIILTLNDLPGAAGITLETKAGMKISFNTSGIEITNGQGGTIKLNGTQVSVNDGALEVI